MFRSHAERRFSGLAHVLAVLAFVVVAPSHAATIQVLVGGGISAPMKELATRFEADTGHHVELHFGTTPDLIRMATSGQAFDAGVVPREVFDSADAKARFADVAPTVVARVGYGVAVKKGAARPDVSTVDKLKDVLLKAKSIAVVPKSAAGTQVTRTFEKLGVAEAIAPHLQAEPGTNELVQAVASGKAELGVFLISTLTDPGLDLAGPFPGEIQQELFFVSAPARRSSNTDVVTSFLDYLLSPPAADVLRSKGMSPGRVAPGSRDNAGTTGRTT
jgi:molybdate transport system substrate-binding protein